MAFSICERDAERVAANAAGETKKHKGAMEVSMFFVSTGAAKAAKCASTPTRRGDANAGCVRIVFESRVKFIVRMGCLSLLGCVPAPPNHHFL